MLSLPETAPAPGAHAMQTLRDDVLLRWRQRLCDEMPALAALPDSLLLDSMPALYDQLSLSVAEPEALRCTSIARAHGAERGRLVTYRAGDLLREYQVLRNSVVEVAWERGVVLAFSDLAAIVTIFDLAGRDALDEFELVRTREHELTLATLSAMLRGHLHVAGVAAQRIMRTADRERIDVLANRIRTRLARIEEDLDGAARDEVTFSEKLPLLLSTFDLAALAREACAESGRAGCTVDAAGSILVTWCRMSVRRALLNLLAEVVLPEVAAPHAPATITVRQAHSRATLTVHHPHVLPPDVVRNLFSARNKEVHPTVREWGTGLAFVRDVAESHGGSAIVHSTAGGGTEFILDVPLDASPFVPTHG
jgi:signal transduction histidine kinase